MSNEELENKYVIAHVITENLFEEDKSLLFDTKDEARDYLKMRVPYPFSHHWYICTVKQHNDLCVRWWGNGGLAQKKSITVSKEIREND